MRKLQFTGQAEKSINKFIKRVPEVARLMAAQIEKLREEPMPRNATKIVLISTNIQPVSQNKRLFGVNGCPVRTKENTRGTKPHSVSGRYELERVVSTVRHRVVMRGGAGAIALAARL